MKGFGEYTVTGGAAFASCTSGRYRLADICDYLRERLEDGDTTVTFEVLDSGDLRIATGNDIEIAEIEASGFEEVL